VPDLAGDTDQIGVIQLRRDIVFVGLGERPAETQGFVEKRQGDIERRLPFFNPKRNLPATPTRTDVIVASHDKGIEAERLLPPHPALGYQLYPGQPPDRAAFWRCGRLGSGRELSVRQEPARCRSSRMLAFNKYVLGEPATCDLPAVVAADRAASLLC
jgi:hypothetical protein